jgi:hypothetical protein
VITVTGDVPSLLGRPVRCFGQFAADYAAAFSSARQFHYEYQQGEDRTRRRRT